MTCRILEFCSFWNYVDKGGFRQFALIRLQRSKAKINKLTFFLSFVNYLGSVFARIFPREGSSTKKKSFLSNVQFFEQVVFTELLHQAI